MEIILKAWCCGKQNQGNWIRFWGRQLLHAGLLCHRSCPTNCNVRLSFDSFVQVDALAIQNKWAATYHSAP